MEPRSYTGESLQSVSFPLGGMGAGMFALEGYGGFSRFSLFHRPDIRHEPEIFAAVSFSWQGERRAVVLEGQVPGWKVYNQPGGGRGFGNRHYGLPRFESCEFSARFPFGTARLWDNGLPLSAEVTGWSPFVPGDSDGSCLPVAAVEYTLANRTDKPLELVFSFHASSFFAPRHNDSGRRLVGGSKNGIVMEYLPDKGEENHGWFAFSCDQPGAVSDAAWMRGHGFHASMANWKHIRNGDLTENPAYPVEDEKQSPGGSIYAPVTLPPGESRRVTMRFGWYVPLSDLREDEPELMRRPEWQAACTDTYRPWYASRFGGIEEVMAYWDGQYGRLRGETAAFTSTLYASTLDDILMDAVTSNLAILKTPTVLRQHDGRLWLYEGCGDDLGSCYGSCTHVWNYAQALCHLFPDLERTLRETEFTVAQEPDGWQTFRVPLPIRGATRRSEAAADGQLGGIVKLYRDYRICGDREWLIGLWPAARQSLEFCIATWDKGEQGRLQYPHHLTYDITLWGPDALGQSLYLAALRAAALLAGELEEDGGRYEALFEKARAVYEGELFNSEYFQQNVMFRELEADYAAYDNEFIDAGHPEMADLMEREGPPYQYGAGCLSDGALGGYLAETAGLPSIADEEKMARHMDHVVRYNFRPSLHRHANPMRGGYALGREAGLLICTWPHGGRPTLPLLYSEEVWTGIEYQVAAHLASLSRTEASLELVRAVRSRYDGRVRNPFDEYECGHYYGRALASYALLQGHTGIRYDAVSGVLTIRPRFPGDFASFLSTATGYGLAGVEKGVPFFRPTGAGPRISGIDFVPYGTEG